MRSRTTTKPPHPDTWVSHGPPNALGGAADWCAIPTTDPELVAPGGVVLCRRDTTAVHPEARRYALLAWAELGRYRAQCQPELIASWQPVELGSLHGHLVRWERPPRARDRAITAPGGWVLMDDTARHPQSMVSFSAEHYATKEWARLAGAPQCEVAAA